MRSTSLLAAVILSSAAVAPVSAFPLGDEPNRLNVPREQSISPSQISEMLREKGYKVIDIELDGDGYEVELIDKNGVRIEGHVYVYSETEGLPGPAVSTWEGL
jgi:Peptidase propeptide and YPEB domain